MRRAYFMIFAMTLAVFEYDTTITGSGSATSTFHQHHVYHNITTDQSALLAMKSHIISDPYQILTNNWSTGVSCCSWVGVICSTRHERVVALNLSYMGLIGTIPPQIGNLSFLVSLVLRNNSFHGELPQELSDSRRLKKIDLRVNKFRGDLPSWFSKLLKLQEILLAHNSFTGTISSSFSNISNLEYLSLGSNHLQGVIPPEIGRLVNLKVLSLQHNQLTGSIPLTIFNIRTLHILALTNNSLSGHLPRDICQGIPNTEGIFLSSNKLSGRIPTALHECSKLKWLELTYNNFTGVIPREIGNLTLLQHLYLAATNLKGTIPQEIGNLRNLHILTLDLNTLTGSIPETIFNISKLKHISMPINRLSGKLPSNIGHALSNLRSIYLGNNYLTGILPDSISNFTALVALDISHNKFTGIIPNSLGNLRLLEFLHLSSNSFSENSSSDLTFLITSLTNCRNLRQLSLSYNLISGYLPVSIGNFSTTLEQIYANDCGIEGIIPNEIGSLSSLIALSLAGNELTGNIPITIKGLTKIQVLDLSDNKIGGHIPDDVCKLQNLMFLGCASNRITGSMPSCLGDITSLRYLHLDSNRLTSNLPVNFGNLEDLLELKVSRNALGGHLPNELGNLKMIVELDLSYNRFSGNISNALGELQYLANLFLENNRLQGPIPDTFKHLLSIENIDLSENNLSGVIPKSLETLLYLRYFNVSSNSLGGEIPTKGPFKNFTSQSFLRNQALCGAPQFQVPSCPMSSAHGSKKKKIVLTICISLVISSIMLTLTFVFMLVRRGWRGKFQSQTNSSPIIAPERIPYHELQQATNGFCDSNLIGMGSFGSVYKAILTNGTIVAIKVFNLQLEGGFKSFDVECEVLRSLRHRNIVKVISCCSNLDFKALVLEYMPNGSLEKWLYSHNHFLDILQRIDVMIEVAYALDYLHYGYSTPMVHCDLKPKNVLLDEDMVAHLSDFGITKLLEEGESIAQTMTLATFGYIAPEHGTQGLVSRKSDVYSYGIMLMEIFTRTKPCDEQILGNMSLNCWVNESIPNSVIQVIDTNLLHPKDGDINEKVQCISSILELALNCSANSPEDRLNIKDVIVAFKKIRRDFLTNRGRT